MSFDCRTRKRLNQSLNTSSILLNLEMQLCSMYLFNAGEKEKCVCPRVLKAVNRKVLKPCVKEVRRTHNLLNSTRIFKETARFCFSIKICVMYKDDLKHVCSLCSV